VKSRIPLAIALATGTAAATALVAIAGPVAAKPASPAAIKAAAAEGASALVAARPSYLQASSDDAFVQHPVISSEGKQYVSYDRTYKGVHVKGGDFVVMTDAAGNVQYTSVAQTKPITGLSVVPKITEAKGLAVAKGQLKKFTSSEGSSLIVAANDSATPALAWETTVRGTNAKGGPSRLTVDVDAVTGKVLSKTEHVENVTGTGTGWINGSVSLATTLSGSTYSMKDPVETTLSCQNAANNTTFTGTDNVWGTGVGTDRETGCVDALYVAQTQTKMLSAWLGRNGQDGSGGAWPIRVGDQEENAYYDGTQVQVGYNSVGKWISSADVLGHELGHGIDDHTPGAISGNGTQEFVADTFGAATEAYANNPNDPPDYQVGEEVNLVGSGPIRYMYNPSLAGDDNCYSSSTPTDEVHAAAGPGNHFFYLLAEGTAPTDGQPTSTTCNSTTGLVGVGIQNAIKIMYNAMLLKTTASSYLKYRTWTLTAAKTLGNGDCTLFNATKAAWNGVSVPAQTADPTCTGGTTPPTTTPTTPPTTTPTTPPTTTPTTPPTGGNLLTNPGFESGSGVGWTSTSGVISTASGTSVPQAGSYFAWLDGYAATHTDTLSQSVAVPAAGGTLSFYLKVVSSETSTTTAYDKLTVKVGSTTLATFSNLNKGSAYAQKSYSLAAFAGQTVTLSFSGVEDSSLATSFQIDTTSIS
jgi:Zn-dependent metalloprotease